jgi:hypothetical protein
LVVFFTAALLAAAVFAVLNEISDTSGNLYRYWLSSGEAQARTQLKISKSIDQGLTFSPPQN